MSRERQKSTNPFERLTAVGNCSRLPRHGARRENTRQVSKSSRDSFGENTKISVSPVTCAGYFGIESTIAMRNRRFLRTKRAFSTTFSTRKNPVARASQCRLGNGRFRKNDRTCGTRADDRAATDSPERACVRHRTNVERYS